MAKTQILEYTVHLRDAALVAELQGLLVPTVPPPGIYPLITLPDGTHGVLRTPIQAGIEFGTRAGSPTPLPLIEAGAPIPVDGAGYITSAWFSPSNDFPRDQIAIIKTTGWWIFGETTRFYWAGRFTLAPSTPVTLPGAIPSPELPGGVGLTQWAFLAGAPVLHHADAGGRGSSTIDTMQGRVPGAGRTGAGMAFRYCDDGETREQDDLTHIGYVNPALTLPGTYLRSVWQRLYFRPVRYGAATAKCWTIRTDAGSQGHGWSLGLTATGQFALYADADNGNATTLLQTFGQTTLGAWTRLDLFCHLPDPPAGGVWQIEVWLNGVVAAQGSRSNTGIFGPITADRRWRYTYIGLQTAITPATDHVWDVDDWVCAKSPPTVDGNLPAWAPGTAYAIGALVRQGGSTYYATAASTGQVPSGVSTAYWQLVADPPELRTGLHVVKVRPDGFGTGHSGWTGDWRVLGQPAASFSGTTSLSSSTANAPLVATLPMATAVDTVPGSLGWIAARVAAAWSKDGNTALLPTLGYQVGSDPPVDVAPWDDGVNVLTSTNDGALNVNLPASRAGTPQRGVPLTLRVTKGNDAYAATVHQLQALVLCVGVFGPEDAAPGGPAIAPVAAVQTQLWELPDTPWSRQRDALGPVLTHGRTYVGNGTGQDLLVPLPLGFWIIRQITNNGTIAHYWTPQPVAQRGYQGHTGDETNTCGQVRDYSFVAAGPDADQQLQFALRIAGTTDTDYNASGTTYQVIGFADPAGRFARAWAAMCSHTHTPWVVPLDDPAFLAEVGFQGPEGTHSGTMVPGLSFKAPGHAADALQPLTGSPGTPILNALTFATGAVTIGDGMILTTPSTALGPDSYSGLLFRQADGNVYPAGHAGVVFLGTYVGDGAASRVIALPPVGKRPLFAHVQSVTGAAALTRDPSHTGTTSGTASTNSQNASTGITAGGIDSFVVGAALNATGVVYNYFGLYGGTAACNNGWSCNGDFFIPSDSPMPPGWEEPVIIEAPDAPTVSRGIRRLRRAPHVNDDHKRVYYRRFELDLERGQATASGAGSAPTITLRFSRDGGHTWGVPVVMAAGTIGEYTTRVLARRLGQARDMVFEVSTTDPVAWSLVQAWLDLEPGQH